MEISRYLELQRAELARLENALNCINLAVQTRHANLARGEYYRQIVNQRHAIAIIEKSIAQAA